MCTNYKHKKKALREFPWGKKKMRNKRISEIFNTFSYVQIIIIDVYEVISSIINQNIVCN